MTELLNTIQAQPEPKRDRYGRYLLPDISGKDQPFTRATTFAKSISDSFGLTNWQLRMAVKGIAMRPDLYALAAATPIEDKSKLDKVAADAKEAAASSSGANLGTALHTFTERRDRGEVVQVPAQWSADVESYERAMATAQVTVMPQWIERIVVVRQLKVAGTLDRILRLGTGELVIGDLKTGKDLSYGWLEICIQLALYAHADAVWNGATGEYEPMPPVSQQHGIVMHTPVGQGKTTLYRLDLAAGWEAAQVVSQVREWRTRKGLATPLKAVLPDDLLIGAIREAPDREALEALWQRNQGSWTQTHTTAAANRVQQLAAGTK